MLEYIQELQKKYKDLESEPFSSQARIAIRQEIEQAKMMLESDKFDDIWENLSAVFNVSPEKPNWHEEERPEVEFDDTHSFKQRMAAKDSAGYQDY